MFLLAGAAAANALDLVSSLQQALSGNNSAQSPTTFDPAATPGTSATPSTTTTSSSAPSAPLSPATMSALFSLQGQGQGQQPLLMVNGDALSQQLFSMLDTNGDGQISQSEFDTAFGQNGNTTQANSLFAQISNGSGSITPQDLTNALDGQDQTQTQGQTQGLTQGMQGHHHHHGGGGGGFDVASLIGGAGGASASGSAGGGSGSNSSTQGDTTQTVTNADGSSTTTISYANGSQVSMTIPGASSSSSAQNSNSGAGSASSLNNFVEQMIQRQAQMLASSTVGQSVAVSA
jgi:hypothetical protein